MKAKLYSLIVMCFCTLNAMGLDPGYHIQLDFSDGSSDNISGWTTNVRSEHPKGGVQVISGLYARFRNGVAAMKSNSAFAYAGTLSFVLKPDSYGTNNPSFKVYISTDGADWDTGWTQVFEISYDQLPGEGETFNVDINSGSTAVYIKLESVNDDVDDSGTEYSFQIDDLELSDETPVSADNVEVDAFVASCMSVSSEALLFEEGADNVYTAHDSIGFDADFSLQCFPVSPKASVEVVKMANPYPGTSDTAVFKITAEDNVNTALVKAIVARSVYQAKFGFVSSIDGKTSEFDGWTFGGSRFPSGSKGNGGAYPGEKAMRLYESSGSITSPMFSGVSTLSFVAKFSKTDGEALKIQKSYDGINFTDVITYTPDEGPIPAYTSESVNDPLSETQTVSINDRNVYIKFLYVNGDSKSSRTMIDDIACKALYDPDETYEAVFTVTDFYNNVVAGAQVTLGDEQLVTDSQGEVIFTDLSFQMESLPFKVSKGDFLDRLGSVLVKNDISKKVVLTSEELDIFLALGQSNMAGRADIGDNTDTLNGAYLLNSEDVWTPAVNPMNIFSNIRKSPEDQKLGPSWSFVKTISKYVENPVCIITNARGGTSITAFAKGGTYYEPLMTRISKANDFGTVKGAIWHQGESNSNNFGSYLELLNSLVGDMREAVNNDFYFVAGQLGGWYSKYESFNTNLTNIQSVISNSDYVVNDRLWHIGDSTHFNTSSQLLLGARYAQKVLEKVYDLQIGVYEFSFSDELFLTNGNDTIRSGNRIIYTTLWSDELTFEVHASDGEVFQSLMINGTEISNVDGMLSYKIDPASRDSVFNIDVTLKGEASPVKILSGDELFFFPNPASGKIFFRGGADDNYNVSVFDMTGRVLLEESGKPELEINSLKPGYYVLYLKSGSQMVSKQLIVY
ncbi:sialate O-acetylesterase [Geofilum sp. OHC36d9]|uniref:sialate O-acetylesterase n=1 Tax=Geofilum sp. OHC36d9 TaxID=3458413 RepID=UPI00403408DB